MKTLILARHAKSSWKNASLEDHERPLNNRGLRDAPMMARRLRDAGLRPDLIVSSTARRALDTAATLAQGLGYPLERLEPRAQLYACTPRTWLDCIAELPEECATVIIVGHNPEITEVARQLSGLDIDNVPTCGILRLDYGIERWRMLADAVPSDCDFDFPKRPH